MVDQPMTGPEHRRQAEELLQLISSDGSWYGTPFSPRPPSPEKVARATAHGLVAIAAALESLAANSRPDATPPKRRTWWPFTRTT